MKVFLVEDEVIMRQGIKNNIPWRDYGYEFVGEASDGELAYPLILKTKPDILITDIKMPFMDGLELSRLVKKELPDTKIIVLSGYDEFDYAKQAISIGITDYLLKPVSSAQLLEAVDKVKVIIEKEREKDLLVAQYEKENQENRDYEMNRYFNDLVSGELSTAEILEKAREWGMDFTGICYTVLLFKVIAQGSPYSYSHDREHFMEDMSCKLTGEKGIHAFQRGAEGWALILQAQDEEELDNLLARMKGYISDTVKKYPGLEYFGGVGNTIQRLGDFHISYREASKAFAGRFFTELNQILSWQEVYSLSGSGADQIDFRSVNISGIDRKRIEIFLGNGTLEEVDGFVEEYFNNVGEENCKSLMFRQYIAMDMSLCSINFIQSQGIELGSVSEEHRDMKNLAENIQSLDSVKGRMKEMLREIIRLRDKQSANKYGALMKEAIAYMQEHYQEDDISLNRVAANINISPGYFSTIFRQEMGRTFVEYLTGIRMEKACEQLMCTSKKTSEIGFDVGYRDSHYFSYIFKKTQGCTPKEYRSRGRS